MEPLSVSNLKTCMGGEHHFNNTESKIQSNNHSDKIFIFCNDAIAPCCKQLEVNHQNELNS